MGNFRVGDHVALRKEYMDAPEAHVSCVRRMRRGLPNDFVVSKTHDLERFEALTLEGCCGVELDGRGVPFCFAHPAGLFDLVERAAEPEAAPEPKPEPTAAEKAVDGLFRTDPKRFVSIELPIIGSLLHVGHYDNGDTEGIALRLGSAKPLLVAGRDLETMAALFSQVKAVANKVRGKG